MLSIGAFCDHFIGGRGVEVWGGDQEKPDPNLLAGEVLTQSLLMEGVQLHWGGGAFVSINILSCGLKWSFLSVCFPSGLGLLSGNRTHLWLVDI